MKRYRGRALAVSERLSLKVIPCPFDLLPSHSILQIMDSSLQLPTTHSASLPVPAENLQSFLTSDPFGKWPTKGEPTAPSKPALVHGGTGASISHSRLNLDSLKVARSLRAIIGEPIKFVQGGTSPVSAGETRPLSLMNQVLLMPSIRCHFGRSIQLRLQFYSIFQIHFGECAPCLQVSFTSY